MQKYFIYIAPFAYIFISIASEALFVNHLCSASFPRAQAAAQAGFRTRHITTYRHYRRMQERSPFQRPAAYWIQFIKTTFSTQHIGVDSQVIASFQQTLWTVQPVSSGIVRQKSLGEFVDDLLTLSRFGVPLRWRAELKI